MSESLLSPDLLGFSSISSFLSGGLLDNPVTMPPSQLPLSNGK